MSTELTPRQIFMLAMLEEDVDAAIGRNDGSHETAMAVLVRFIVAEKLPEELIHATRQGLLTHARFAASLVRWQSDFRHGCYGRAILIAAGVIDPNEPPEPDPDDEDGDAREENAEVE